MATSPLLIQTLETCPSSVDSGCVPRRYIFMWVCFWEEPVCKMILLQSDFTQFIIQYVALSFSFFITFSFPPPLNCLPALHLRYFLCLSVFTMKQHLCVYTAFIHKLVTKALKGEGSIFTISLLIHPLTVKSCLNSEGPTKERTGRSFMSALRVLWPFTFFLVILSLWFIPSRSFCLFLSLQLCLFGKFSSAICFVKCWWITTER